MQGFYGKIIRVNLTDQTFVSEIITEDIYRKHLGGKGLGSYLLLENIAPGIEPLSDDNKLIFTTGFATGTNMFGSSRYGIFTKSPLTGLYAETYSGGNAAIAINATGYDAIIVEGAAHHPVYLEISDEVVLFHSANRLWGKETYETEDAVLAEVNVPSAKAVVIGPAGENLVRFACVENNYWRSAGRTGVGAVMGAKKVKAIVFHGKSKAELAEPELMKDLLKEIVSKAKDSPGVKAYQKYGTTQMVAIMNEAKAFPTKYWADARFDKWEKISGDALHQNFEVKSKACPKCFLSCGNLCTVKEGRHQGLTFEGPEYETINAFGGLCCIDQLDEIIYLNDICDRLGIDTITAGNLVALVMAASEKERIPFALNFGDAEGAAQLLKDIASGRGIGKILALGIKYAAKELGLEDLAVHVKGLEPPGYDPRRLKGMALAFATSTRGACHLRATFYKPELSGMVYGMTTKEKAELFIDYENRLTVFNTGILCVFYRDLLKWEDLQKMVKAITGWEYTEQELKETANRIISITRIFNAREGATKKEDRLPARFYSEKVNNDEDSITPEELTLMVDEYYLLRGWNDSGY